MKKGILKKIAMCFALVIAMCFAKGADAKAAEEVGTVINVNEKVTGAFEQSDDVDWYTFHITERSVTNLKMGVNSIVDKDKAEYGWCVYLYNEQYELVKEYGQIISQTELTKLPLGKGTYYIKIEAEYVGFSGDCAPVDCTYALTVQNTVTDNWEIEKNESKSQATTIAAHKEYHGLFHHSEDVDWYKVNV